jgi:hypothetical protein
MNKIRYQWIEIGAYSALLFAVLAGITLFVGWR